MIESPAAQAPLRYPGSPPFEDRELDRELFFGRADDAESILHSILSHDLFVLYARSGIGKTSVLKAGVMQSLRDRELWPILVRLHDTERDPLDLVRSALHEADADERIEILGVDDQAQDLWNLLTGLEIWRTRDDVLLLPVLIFDQFEELFTLWDAPHREAFIEQFASVVRRVPPTRDNAPNGSGSRTPHVKFVLSLREDFLGGLEAFSPQLPQILSNRQRLQPLTRPQAEDAIRKPALVVGDLESPQFGYDDDTVKMILDFLGESQSGSGGYSNEAEIEAFQLQILCHHIESVVLPRKLAIPNAEAGNEASDVGLPVVTPDDVEGPDGLRSILKQTYSREVEAVASLRQRSRIRRLCEVGLIRDGRRRFVAKDDIQREYRVTDQQLDRLIDARLLRMETRAGTAYYELAHDSLVDPLLAYRAEKTRQNRKRALGIAAIVCAVAIGLLIWWLVTSRSDDVQGSFAGGAGPTVIRVGENLPDRLDSDVEFDVYQVVVTADDGSAILRVSSEAIAQVELFSSGSDATESTSGAPIGVGTALGTLVFIPEPGVYTAVVRPLEGISAGSYDLALQPADVMPITSEGTETEVDEVENGEIDVFRFTAEPGQARTIVLRPLGQLDGAIELIGPGADRLPIVDAASSGEPENVTLPIFTSGAYHVVVRSVGDSSGDYALEIQTSEARELSSDEIVEGELIEPGEVDVFTFAAGDSDIVSLEVESSGSLDAVIDLIGPDRRRVAQANETGLGDAERLTTVVTPGDAAYVVRVEGVEDSFGAYTIRRSASTAQQIDEVEGASGGLEVSSETDRLTFTGDVGDAVTLTVTGAVDAVVGLIDPAARRVALVDDAGSGGTETITGIVSRAGTYVLEVSAFGTSVGDYVVSLDRSPSTPVDPTDSTSGAIDSGNAAAAYTFLATAGDAVTVTVRAAEPLETSLGLIDPSGRLFAREVASTAGATLTTTEIVPETGTYIAQVSGRPGSEGTFEFDVATVPVDELATDRVGGGTATSSGAIENAGDVNVLKFSGSTGDVMTLSLDVEAGLDGAIEVIGPDGDVLTTADSEAAGEGEDVTALLPEGGVYIVRIQGFDDTTGDYEVRLQRSSVAVMKPGAVRDETIADAGEIDAYEVAGSAGQVVTMAFDATSELDGILTVLDPDGVVLAEADARGPGGDESLTIVFPIDGPYRVLVSGEDDASGGYTLALEQQAVVPLEAGSPVLGTLDSTTEVDAFEFSGPADGVVSLTLEPGDGLDGQMRVLNPNSVEIASIDDLDDRAATETITLKLPIGGTYRVFVSGFVSAGDYTLSFDEPDIAVIKYGDSVPARISTPEQLDAYTFVGAKFEVPTIAVVPDATLNAIVDVIDPNGGETQVVDSAGPGEEERFTLTLPEDRDYFLRVRGADGTTGEYTLLLIAP